MTTSDSGARQLPRTETARGFRLIGASDLRGHGDGMQVYRHENALYVGHAGSSGMGTTILDASDPTDPRVVDQWPAPSGTRTPKVQVADGLLLVNHERWPPRIKGSQGWGSPGAVGAASPFYLARDRDESGSYSAGMPVFDVSEPLSPKQIGRFDFEPGTGEGVHRIVWTGGDWAHSSMWANGRMEWIVFDMSDPTKPREAARWALDEEPPDDEFWGAHHALLDGDIAYLAYADAGIVVLDVSDFSRPRMLGRERWGGTHTHTTMPLPGRRLLIVADEAHSNRCDAGHTYVWVMDISDPVVPRMIARCPEPDGDFCSRGLRFGPHNLHENREGTYRSERLIFTTYFNAGIRVYNLQDPEAPVEVAHWLPEAPAGQEAPQLNDLFVEASGIVWATDRINGGLYVLQADDEFASLMHESSLDAKAD